MWAQFIAQNIHFASNLFVALVLAAICWLYLDAWTGHREKKELLKWLGFGVLSASFFTQATTIELPILETSMVGGIVTTLLVLLRLVGYGLLLTGLVLSPLQAVPKTAGLELKKPASKKHSAAALTIGGGGGLAMAAGGIAAAVLYWRLATVGLERHFKRLAIGFLAIGLSDLVALAAQLRGTDDPILYQIVAPFGWLWWLSLLFLVAGGVWMCVWVWSYLTKRFFSQLFMIFMITSVVIFFVVSVSLTALLLRSVWLDALANMDTAANVLGYALKAKQAEASSGAEQLASSSDVRRAVTAGDHAALASLTADYLPTKQQSSLVIATTEGRVLVRAEDPARWGDSLSGDILLRRAMLGKSVQTVASVEQVAAPAVYVRSASPVRNDQGAIIGVVMTGLRLDSAFVDGIKSQTGLQSSIYAGDTVAATTLLTSDAKTRPTGARLADQAITARVLEGAQRYAGSLSFQNRQLIAVFSPLKDVDNGVVGMLMIAQPQTAALRTAGQSIEVNFLATALLILFSIVPIYYISRMIERQLD